MNGLVIEIDGPVHNYEGKMKRDNSKFNGAHFLNIATLCIENEDLKCFQIKSFLEGLSSVPLLDSREKSRLLKKVYLITILKNSTEEELESFFGKKSFSKLQKIRRLI